MSEVNVLDNQLVFGLDIGTRNVVGTVGYRMDGKFIVIAQYMEEHETRAMLDGQIHDIGRVGRTIQHVKVHLEEQVGIELTEVCIAAAGRVLKTVNTNITVEFDEETVVDGEAVHTLDLLGIEKAQDVLKETNDTKYKFYCVGYSVVKYYLDDDPFSNIEAHKAKTIGEDIIVTFLPEDVVDGLYAAVGMAGLSVANLTLEPIAAINIAIPENYRLLNIALIDVGAGTSDISVTRDGSIIAYGMIPLAGDELTEAIVQEYLVDFKTAEYIKRTCGRRDEVTYKDIMLIDHTLKSTDLFALTDPIVDRMTTEVADKIKELNGDKTVSAAFVVGGGGKIHGYTEMLADKLGIARERVALRGEEVLGEVVFEQVEIKKDPLLVTPIGICLNYYDQRNSFIMVRFNGEHIKLYNNDKLTIVDAALQAGYSNEDLFPKRGNQLEFTVNGVTRTVRGVSGESAEIFMNDKPASINTPLTPNCDIVIHPSTSGDAASYTLGQLDEAKTPDVTFVVNGSIVRCPKFLEVNGSIELPSYEIKNGDDIETRNFYTVGQLAEFMDVDIDADHEILVNNRPATKDSLIYENFAIEWTIGEKEYPETMTDETQDPTGADKEQDTQPEDKKEAAVTAEFAEEPEAAQTSDTLSDDRVVESAAENTRADEAESAQDDVAENVKAEDTEMGQMNETAPYEETAISSKISTAEYAEPAGEIDAVDIPVQPDTSEAASETVAEVPDMPMASSEAVAEMPATSETDTAEVPDMLRKETTSLEIDIKDYRNEPERSASENPVVAELEVYINDKPVTLKGKDEYIFVNIFDFYDFDLKASGGRSVITRLNGESAPFTAVLKPGDKIELGWDE